MGLTQVGLGLYFIFLSVYLLIDLLIYLVLRFTAGHFLGNHSIIDIMRREGFAVHHMKPGQPLPKYEVYLKLMN